MIKNYTIIKVLKFDIGKVVKSLVKNIILQAEEYWTFQDFKEEYFEYESYTDNLNELICDILEYQNNIYEIVNNKIYYNIVKDMLEYFENNMTNEIEINIYDFIHQILIYHIEWAKTEIGF